MTRPGLPRHTRSLISCHVIALNRGDEIRLHLVGHK